MNAKRTLFVRTAAAVLLLAACAFVLLRPRHYYRYDGIGVYLVTDKNSCWNGLARSPVVEFGVPMLACANAWKPSPEQIRKAIADSNVRLSEEDTTMFIKSCVSVRQAMNGVLNKK